MIALEGLTKEYRARGGATTLVLDDISLSVDRGEIAAVVGPSGAGKSTLAKCINLLERPTRGRVLLDGKDLTALGRAELRTARHGIGTVFQSSALLRRRTAAQNVALPLEFMGVTEADTRDRVAELLDLVGLGTRGDAVISELSGGQQQRVGIARALALRPSVLLADEATSGLDPATTRSILELISRIREELHLTVLMITHEMNVVLDAADTVYRLDHGRVVESGRVTGVLVDPSSGLASDLIPQRAWATPAGRAWSVQYAAHDVASDWLHRVSIELGAPVGLLGGSVEVVDGVTVGRAVVDVPTSAAGPAVRAAFERTGLAAVPVGAADPAATRSVAAAPRRRRADRLAS